MVLSPHFGGGGADTDHDKGHFVVQPSGNFQQPLRRCEG